MHSVTVHKSVENATSFACLLFAIQRSNDYEDLNEYEEVKMNWKKDEETN
jgi:hypothetical protein